MSLWKMVNKFKNIIIGTYNNIFNKNNIISKPRLEICNICEYKVKVKGIGDICGICGCILKSKTTVDNEKCPKNKW